MAVDANEIISAVRALNRWLPLIRSGKGSHTSVVCFPRELYYIVGVFSCHPGHCIHGILPRLGGLWLARAETLTYVANVVTNTCTRTAASTEMPKLNVSTDRWRYVRDREQDGC